LRQLVFFFSFTLKENCFKAGNFKLAISFFSDAIKIFPNEYLLWGFRAAALTENLQYTNAHEDALKVIELQPNRAEGHLRLGNVLCACDEFQKAKESYLTALKLEPSHDLTVEALREMDTKRKIVHLRRAVTDAREAFENGNFFKASALLTDCIELNPRNSAYLVYRALVRCAQGDVEGASQDASRIVVVDSVRKKRRTHLFFFLKICCFVELPSTSRACHGRILAKAWRWSGSVRLQDALFRVERTFFVVLQNAFRSDSNRCHSARWILCEIKIRRQGSSRFSRLLLVFFFFFFFSF
jgi:tetratricopeptide (TPR) repeat protein